MADDEKAAQYQLPQWDDYLTILAGGDELLNELPAPEDEKSRQELYQLLLKSLAGGMFSAYSHPDFPDFVPSVNTVLNTVGVNPDFIYGYTKIDGKGVYRLSGSRGDGLFVMFDFVAGGLGVLDQMGSSISVLDLDNFSIGPKGEFDILLSAARPEDYSGDWFRLDPSTQTLTNRQASYDWGVGNDARIAIERLDIAHQAGALSAKEISSRLEALMAYPRFYAGFTTHYINHLRDNGYINKLEHDDWAGRGGVEGQHYYQGIFRLEPGQALILETALPEAVRYWNVQLTDMLWNSIDWMNHQSSLNGAQALIDSDGRFRAVISDKDPGVANWLDTGGCSEGTLMLRWNEASSGPAPTLRSVPLASVKDALPADTVTVSTEERQQRLRERRRSVQLRRRW